MEGMTAPPGVGATRRGWFLVQGGYGDEDRFRALFEACSPAVLAYAVRRTANPTDAADVVAETFVVAWRRIGDVPVGDEARLWLFGVARRVLSNHRRGSLRRSRLADRLRTRLADVHIEDPSAAVEAVQIVRAGLALLDDDDRELLLLTSWEGLTPTELAAVLGVPAATVRTRLHRARGRLRDALGSIGWDGERSISDGHVMAGERVLAQETECE